MRVCHGVGIVISLPFHTTHCDACGAAVGIVHEPIHTMHGVAPRHKLGSFVGGIDAIQLPSLCVHVWCCLLCMCSLML